MIILMAGDVVGSAGRVALASVIERRKAAGRADFVVVNAENSAGGKGITADVARDFFKAGADVLTLGDHTWDQKGVGSFLEQDRRVVRPVNFAPGCPGRGWTTINTAWCTVTVASVVGRVFMKPYECPFRAMDGILARRAELGAVVLVDIHAEATSEKIVMGRYLDGRVTAVAGTHTHVQTSDERILPKGTAYITDLGMCGPSDSALGRDLGSVTAQFLTGMPAKFELGKGPVVVEGIEIDVDRGSGKAVSIQRFRETI
jgi:metallophosphoesterase (TIGR00282 family)